MTESSEQRKARKAMEAAMANSVPLSVSDEKEVWSVYTLSDGSKLRIKPLVMDVRKSKTKGADGKYPYHIRANVIIDVQDEIK